MNKKQIQLILKVVTIFALAGFSSVFLSIILPSIPYLVMRTFGGQLDEGLMLLMSVLGILGLTGIWMLLTAKDFKKKSKRNLVAAFLISGVIAAIFTMLVMMELGVFKFSNIIVNISSIIIFSGLPILILAAIIAGKIRLLPKK